METQGTVEKIIMSKQNGEVSIGIAVRFFDKYHSQELDKLAGYSLRLEPNEPDGWLVFHGEPEAKGPWLFFGQEFFRKNIEVLGEL